MYILSYNLALFGGSGIKISLDVCHGISSQRHKVYIFSYKPALFDGYGMKIGLDICCGICVESKGNCRFEVTNCLFFVDLE